MTLDTICTCLEFVYAWQRLLCVFMLLFLWSFQVLDHIKKNNPRAPICAVGYSAGANVLLRCGTFFTCSIEYTIVTFYVDRYLAEQGSKAPLACAIAVSGCLDFVQCSENVNKNENSTYRIFLAEQVRKCVRRHIRHLRYNSCLAWDCELFWVCY